MSNAKRLQRILKLFNKLPEDKQREVCFFIEGLSIGYFTH